jgi:hypothetical protein
MPINTPILDLSHWINKTYFCCYMPINTPILDLSLPIKIVIFPNPSREVISLTSLIISYNDDNTIDKDILGRMEGYFPPSNIPPIKY